MYNNCVVWALWKRLTKGGHIHVSKSPAYWYIPRVLWSPDKKNWYYFCPYKRTNTPNFLQNLFPIHTLLFKGRVIKVHDPYIRHSGGI